MSTIKSIAKDWLPPLITRSLRSLHGCGIRFDGEFSTWEEAAARCTGYDAEHILAKVLDATLKVKRGEAAFERDSVLFDEIEYAWPVTAGLMWAAARNGGRLNVLDFGGALGSHFFQNQKFLKSLKDVHWCVVEQGHYVAAGKEHIEDDYLRFYATLNDCMNENKPNVILLSSVLQYLPQSDLILNNLINLNIDCIILDRVPYLNSGARSIIKIQNTPASIYSASYPCQFFVEEVIIERLTGCGYALVETFKSLDKLDDSAIWKGHIFYKVQLDD